MMTDRYKKSNKLFNISFIIIACSTFFAPTIKLNFIVGSFFNFFSIKSCITPLAGAFGGISGGIALTIARLVYGLMGTGIASLSMLALYVPGLFGSLYWATQSALIRVFVPVTCMILFSIHPIGSQAGAYALLWLIPVVLHYIPYKNILLESLGSTYTTHAVGSVIWLYTVGMTPAAWLGLIPVAFMERTQFAFGMSITYIIVSHIESAIHYLIATYIPQKKAVLSR